MNNAGIYPATLTPDLSDADLNAMLAVNVRAPTYWSPTWHRAWSRGGPA
ncbi:hypothetical protein GCM10009741_76870 [Kribbella lupini]|uniref:Short subunit dehydrogenase n=1 Tax=Kribbella lupini TaxID=291602 RepID=A0ABP4NDW3_9ACTN